MVQGIRVLTLTFHPIFHGFYGGGGAAGEVSTCLCGGLGGQRMFWHHSCKKKSGSEKDTRVEGFVLGFLFWQVATKGSCWYSAYCLGLDWCTRCSICVCGVVRGGKFGVRGIAESWGLVLSLYWGS